MGTPVKTLGSREVPVKTGRNLRSPSISSFRARHLYWTGTFLESMSLRERLTRRRRVHSTKHILTPYLGVLCTYLVFPIGNPF